MFHRIVRHVCMSVPIILMPTDYCGMMSHSFDGQGYKDTVIRLRHV